MRINMVIVAFVMLITATQAYAGNGDLIVDGNVGIGTSSPSTKLHIEKAIASKALSDQANSHLILRDLTSAIEGVGGVLLLEGFKNNTSEAGTFAAIDAYKENSVSNDESGSLRFHTTDSVGNVIEKMRITSLGRVGIGTSIPNKMLEIRDASPTEGSIRINQSGGATYSSGMEFYTTGTVRGYVGWRGINSGSPGTAYGMYLINYDNSNLILATNNVERMRIDTNGKVGIGTTTPSYTLHVNGSFAAASKNFDIKDPRFNDENKRLVHSTLEGPEIGVFYRGEVRLQNGKAEIVLPPYFEVLTRQENRSVLLTAKYESIDEELCSVAASSVIDGKFNIRAFGVANPNMCNHRVYWEVKAERSDMEQLKVEQIREEPK